MSNNDTNNSSKKEKPFGVIYKATNIVNGKVYIGQTIQTLTIRKNAHLNNAFDKNIPNTYFYNAINKHGREGFKWEKIDKAKDFTELNDKEIQWIAYYNSHGEGGYNLTDGGEGVRGYKVTEEGIERRKRVLNEMWANGHAETMKIGEDHPRAILKNKDVLQIKDLLIEGIKSQTEISNLFNCLYSTVNSIKMGSSWTHLISKEDVIKMNSHENKGVNKLSDEQIVEIKNMLIETEIPTEEIYDIFNIGSSAMWYLLDNKKWSHLFTKNEISKIKNRKNKRVVSKSEIIEIKFLLSQKRLKQKEIGELLEISPKYISKIARGERWKDIQIPEGYKSNIN